MKKYEVYRNIRKRAMIMGLPISLFALMVTAIIGSLLFIIFSFSVVIVFGAFLFIAILYIVLTHVAKNPSLWQFKKVFPQTISNKRQNPLDYEDN